MLHLVLAGFALLTVQDPDRSTPEKVFEVYMAAWDRERVEVEKAGQDIWDIHRLSAYYRGEKLKAKFAKDHAFSQQYWKDHATLSTKFVALSKSEEKDGVVIVEGREEIRRNRRPKADGPLEVFEIRMPHRLVLEKAGAGWAIREVFNGDIACEGTGQCSICKGTGKVTIPELGNQPPQVLECSLCLARKICSICEGRKLIPWDPGNRGWGYLIPDKEPEDSKDLSTPQSTAKAIVDVLLREKLDYSKQTQAESTRALAALSPYLAAGVRKAWKDADDAAVAEGKKKFATARAKIVSVEEKGDLAFVVIVEPPYWRNVEESKMRYLLKKTDQKWLVESEQYPCTCEKPKECDNCKGSGWWDPLTD